jgi:hypothetical protein
MDDGAIVRRARRHAHRTAALTCCGFPNTNKALCARVDRVQRCGVGACRGQRLVSEMPESIAHAIRARRSVRDALFRHRAIARDQHDAGGVDRGIRGRGLSDALCRHDRGRVVPVDNNGLITRGNAGRDPEMVDLNIPRFAGSIARFAPADGRHLNTTVGNRRRLGGPRVAVCPHRDRNAACRASGGVRPAK